MGNKANRTCAKVDIRDFKTREPFLYFEKANATGLELSGDAVYAKAMGANAIGFDNPWDGSFTIEAQVFPLEYIALLSDGKIEDQAVDGVKKSVVAETAGTLTIPDGVTPGTLFVYPEGEWGKTKIDGTFAGTTFTATKATDITVKDTYEIGYLCVKKTGVRKVSLNNDKTPRDYFVTLLTNDKDEDGTITAKKYIIYKAKPNRKLSIKHASDGDPMSVTIEFKALVDGDGNYVDMLELD